eukprot:CAMPEP_0177571586 /NCGR_PEP_ID=MMETSP0369-20130122/77515_1 /TAXON_ID=447022 ORGANISM="Scrippsiella hangoei-like, Strain SHHI-4" /NCGR_SAMPLE_ID=MMETSP0369 /ASSEMBLY_ACC=CAM_ASM_000364 /LENGTH=40 /DNA_ID= /DNA_START= /DNA_END= /DNA_ORIENTATION=
MAQIGDNPYSPASEGPLATLCWGGWLTLALEVSTAIAVYL